VTGVVEDIWGALARLTPARIALGRSGSGLPTREVMRFSLAHAQARDAVHTALDAEAVEASIRELGFQTLRATSAATGRDIYRRRPDLGRRLSDESRADLLARPADKKDLGIVVADGLSSAAVHAQVAPFLAAMKPWIAAAGWSVTPVVVATQARVALGDEIGALLGCRAVAVLIGERPGLSSPDSLGAYLTLDPRPGRNDAERNCISNIRVGGLGYDLAAFKLAWLLETALKRSLTGVKLKDDSDALLVAGKPPTPVRLAAPDPQG
jgi:ethanolamine ammonia-lyase small subunit